MYVSRNHIRHANTTNYKVVHQHQHITKIHLLHFNAKNSTHSMHIFCMQFPTFLCYETRKNENNATFTKQNRKTLLIKHYGFRNGTKFTKLQLSASLWWLKWFKSFKNPEQTKKKRCTHAVLCTKYMFVQERCFCATW